MKKLIISLAIGCIFTIESSGKVYTYEECQGSLGPYPENVMPEAYPDSLTPVFINHVGRHGARFPSSSSNSEKLLAALSKAQSLGTITANGRKLLELTKKVITKTDGRWGILDSLGMAEQRGIASRMYRRFQCVFKSRPSVTALASYSPRAMMSMYCFTNQLDIENTGIEFSTTTGHQNSYLMRPFDIDSAYLLYRKDKAWLPLLDTYMKETVPTQPIEKALGVKYPFENESEKRDLAMAEYTLLAGLEAMGMKNEAPDFLSLDEMNRLWSCYNLRQYYERTSTSISSVPADIAGALLLDLVITTDRATIEPTLVPGAQLRFGHAETLMPLLSLMNLKGCNAPDATPSEVKNVWTNFYVVPMASNLQLILFRSESGQYYLRTDLNETTIPLIPGDTRKYIPWGEARRYLLDRVPAK